MRGTGQSEGKFTLWRGDADDGYDTMKWISEQAWSNGTVFSTGASADGLAQFVQPLDQPPWLKGQFIMVAAISAYETFYPGGAYRHTSRKTDI
jgi:predicted acyl esterase